MGTRKIHRDADNTLAFESDKDTGEFKVSGFVAGICHVKHFDSFKAAEAHYLSLKDKMLNAGRLAPGAGVIHN